MKKFMLSLLLVTLAIFIGTNVYAIESPIEVGPFPGIEDRGTNKKRIDSSELIDYMITERIDNHTLTNLEIDFAKRALENYQEISKYIDSYEARSSVPDENWWNLRYGNLIESVLDFDEGISLNDWGESIYIANGAKNLAIRYFNNYYDPAQHFMWNFNLSIQLNKYKARTVTNNHEWGISMISPMVNYYERIRIEYINRGFNDDNASKMAMSETVAYIPSFKYMMVRSMRSNFDLFDAFFNDDCIMDFWNNCYGRAYTERGFARELDAFNHAFYRTNDIIKETRNITYNQKYSVWQWDWYSY